MNDLLVTPIHVLCVAGPDAGRVFVPTAAGGTLGRESDFSVRDRETSREHLFMRSVATRRGARLELTDTGSSNGFATGRWVAPAPGFARNWAWLKAVKSGAGPAILSPGSVFVVGANLWEVRARPISFDLEKAVDYDDPKRAVGRRSWMFLLPFISILWLLSRFLGGKIALIVAGSLAAIGIYAWLAVRSRRRPKPRWGIVYGLGLPPRGASVAEEAGHSMNSSAPPSRSGSAPAHRLKGNTRTTSKDNDWIIDFSPAPTLKRIRLPALFTTFLLVIPKFRRGHSIHIQEPVDIALHDGTEWTEWVLAQALVHARLAGIPAHIRPDAPSILCDGNENPMLTIRTTPGAADYIIQCPPSTPLQVEIPVVSSRKDSGLPSCVLVNELPDPATKSDKRGLRVPVGISEGGVVSIDLVEDGPHALVAGTTGSGKSEALRTWIAQMCRARGPDSLRLVLIDYKGGAAFRDLTGLPHVEGLLTDLDAGSTARAIAGLSCELTRREEALAAKGWGSLDDWESREPATAPARIVCVIDEFRAMIRTHPDTLDDLVDLAARGRSLGMHLIAATQSPGGVVTPAMRANLTLRICLRTADASDSMEVLGSAGAAELPRIPGRAIVDAGVPRVVQWAYCDDAAEAAEASGERMRALAPVPTATSFHTSAPSTPTSTLGPTLWLPELPEVISHETARLLLSDCGHEAPDSTPRLRPAPGIDTPIFALADDIHAREYRALDISSDPIAIIGPANRRAPALQAAANASNALVINTAATEINDAAHALDMACRHGRAVGIDDLGEFLRAAESWGMGVGQSWWRDFLRKHRNGLIVGVDSADYGLVRAWSRAVLRMPASQSRAIALPRDVATLAKDGFVTYPWDGDPPTKISLLSAEGEAEGTPGSWRDAKVGSAGSTRGPRVRATNSLLDNHARATGFLQSVGGSEPTAVPVEPLAASSEIFEELQKRMRGAIGQQSESEISRVDILGTLDVEVMEVLERSALECDAEVNRFTELDLAGGGYRARSGVVTVLGEVNSHALRSVKLPPYVRADSAENSAIWVGFCDLWYRLFPLRH